jgi:hypothetical protein
MRVVHRHPELRQLFFQEDDARALDFRHTFRHRALAPRPAGR